MQILNAEDRQVIQEGIANYEYINKQGRLDLEAFCRTLSACFDWDGVLHLSPNPSDIYLLLVKIIRQTTAEAQANKWIQLQRLVDWTPEVAQTYPNKHRTYIHAAALALHWSAWISEIGYGLMDIPQASGPVKYYNWVKEEWFFTHMFIEGFHNKVTDLFIEMDRESITERGFSLVEALHKSLKEDVDYLASANSLQLRNSTKINAIERIRTAMDARFYLESIALEECLISNCIANFLNAKGGKNDESSLFKLVERMHGRIATASPEITSLFREIDKWRKDRNTAVHGFITSSISDFVKSENTFIAFSRTTAETGLGLCERVTKWYDDESVRFVPMRFPPDADGPLH